MLYGSDQLLMCTNLRNVGETAQTKKHQTCTIYFEWIVLAPVMIPNHPSDTHAALSSGEGKTLAAQVV
jgi:hypothetical protein